MHIRFFIFTILISLTSSAFACEVGDTSCGYWGDDNGTCSSSAGGYYSCTCTPAYSYHECINPGDVKESSYSDEFDFTCPSEAGPNNAPVIYCIVEDQGGAGVTVHRIGTLLWRTGECGQGTYDQCPESCTSAVPGSNASLNSDTCECAEGATKYSLDSSGGAGVACCTEGTYWTSDNLTNPLGSFSTSGQCTSQGTCHNDNHQITFYFSQTSCWVSDGCPGSQGTDGISHFCFDCPGGTLPDGDGVCSDTVACDYDYQIRVSATECKDCPVLVDSTVEQYVDSEHNSCKTKYPTEFFSPPSEDPEAPPPPDPIPDSCTQDSEGNLTCTTTNQMSQDYFCSQNPEMCDKYNVGGCGDPYAEIDENGNCSCKDQHCVVGTADFTCWDVVPNVAGGCTIDSNKDGSGDCYPHTGGDCHTGTVLFNGKCCPDSDGDGKVDGGEVKSGEEVVSDNIDNLENEVGKKLDDIAEGQCGGPGQPKCSVQMEMEEVQMPTEQESKDKIEGDGLAVLDDSIDEAAGNASKQACGIGTLPDCDGDSIVSSTMIEGKWTGEGFVEWFSKYEGCEQDLIIDFPFVGEKTMGLCDRFAPMRKALAFFLYLWLGWRISCIGYASSKPQKVNKGGC